jgi:DNA-binding HxlR family transcriptional regulator
MATRTYHDRCGIARALDIVGERWALLVVRELLLGPKRFTDLRAGLPKVGPDVLSQRLRDLEAAGLVERGTLLPPAASAVYSLTERGAALEPVVIELGRWGSAAPVPSPDAPLGPDAIVIALKTLYAGAPFDGVVELRLGDAVFEVVVRDGVLRARRGEADAPDLVIEGEPGPLAAALWHGGAVDELRIEGGARLARRFLGLFPLPTH